MSETVTQQELPYEEITQVVTRDFMRKNFTVSSRTAYQIPVDHILERPGFNKRIVYEEMDELAASIKANTEKGLAGLLQPLTVDVLPDGRVFIDKGHRRFKAIQMLLAQGVDIQYVECYPNSGKMTEQRRMEDVYNSNMFAAHLKPIEQAAVVYDLKNNFGKVSNEQIAAALHISRQKVDNLLLIADADDQLKHEITSGNLGYSEALSLIRQNRKAKKQGEKKEEDSHKTSPSVPPPQDNLKGYQQEAETLTAPGEDQGEYKTDTDIQSAANDFFEEDTPPVSPSVITEPPAGKEKEKYDEGRDEIKQIQNCIKLADKLEAIVNKFDVPDGAKKDVVDVVKWLQKGLAEVREWIHKNKKQNKR